VRAKESGSSYGRAVALTIDVVLETSMGEIGFFLLWIVAHHALHRLVSIGVSLHWLGS
jgi:hypothetical protein